MRTNPNATIGRMALTLVYALQKAMDQKSFRDQALSLGRDALAIVMRRTYHGERQDLLDCYAWAMCLTSQEKAELEALYIGEGEPITMGSVASGPSTWGGGNMDWTIWLARPAYKPGHALDDPTYEYIPHGGPIPLTRQGGDPGYGEDV